LRIHEKLTILTALRFKFNLSAVLADAFVVVKVGSELGLALIAVECACRVFAVAVSLACCVLICANLCEVFFGGSLSALVERIFA